MGTGCQYVIHMTNLLLEINREVHGVPMAFADQIEIFVLGLKDDYHDEVIKDPAYRMRLRNESTFNKICRLVTALDDAKGLHRNKDGAFGRKST